MSTLVFQVIDTACEATNQSFFPPRIALSAVSTTRIATVIGFPEYAGFTSTPPKRYKTLTWDGTSEQQLFSPAFVTPAYNYYLTDYFGPTARFAPVAGGFGYQGVGIGDGGIVFFGHWCIFFNDTFNTIYESNRFAALDPLEGVFTKFQGDPALPATITATGPFFQPPVVVPVAQIAGAKFDYSGSSTIDGTGKYTTLYQKNLSSMCQATGRLVTCFLQGVNGGLENYVFVGWLGPAGHQKCPPPGIPYSSVGNQAIGKGDAALFDISFLWGSKRPNPASAATISNFIVNSATGGTCVDSGTTATIALFEPVPQGVLPQIDNTTQNIVWFFANVVFDHNYSSILTDEYTDAEALTNARVITGNGTVAQNFPRTTGFVSSFTSVVYTLVSSNLIAGQNYVVTVDLADLTSGITTSKQYPFTADATGKNTTIDIIATPLVGHSVVVRNPQIQFA